MHLWKESSQQSMAEHTHLERVWVNPINYAKITSWIQLEFRASHEWNLERRSWGRGNCSVDKISQEFLVVSIRWLRKVIRCLRGWSREQANRKRCKLGEHRLTKSWSKRSEDSCWSPTLGLICLGWACWKAWKLDWFSWGGS